MEEEAAAWAAELGYANGARPHAAFPHRRALHAHTS